MLGSSLIARIFSIKMRLIGLAPQQFSGAGYFYPAQY
jgi:hypothetical protein